MSLIEEECTTLAQQLLSACEAAQLKFATAESCTGGLIAAYLTEIAGSSAVIERGFVTYSNEAKNEMLGVPMNLIIQHGAVSEPVARAMAEGAMQNSLANLAVSVTGIAGPSGGTAEKPVGRVHMAVAQEGQSTIHAVHTFDGNRYEVRQQTVAAALHLSLQSL